MSQVGSFGGSLLEFGKEALTDIYLPLQEQRNELQLAELQFEQNRLLNTPPHQERITSTDPGMAQSAGLSGAVPLLVVAGLFAAFVMAGRK